MEIKTAKCSWCGKEYNVMNLFWMDGDYKCSDCELKHSEDYSEDEPPEEEIETEELK